LQVNPDRAGNYQYGLKVEEQKAGSTGSGIRELFKLYRFLKPYRWIFALGMAFLLISSGASLLFPKYLGNMVDLANQGSSMNEITRTGIILLAVVVVQAIFSYFRTRIFVMVTEKTLASIRQHIYKHLIKLPMSFFSERRVGELKGSLTAGSRPTLQSFSIRLPKPLPTFCRRSL